jgi:hypothetical protein
MRGGLRGTEHDLLEIGGRPREVQRAHVVTRGASRLGGAADPHERLAALASIP